MDSPSDHREGPEAPDRDDIMAFWQTAEAHGLEVEALNLWGHIAVLKSWTGWDEDTLRSQLRCDLKAFADQDPERARQSLLLSEQYMTWLRELVGWLGRPPAPSVTRRVLFAARNLFDGVGDRPSLEGLERCRVALAAPSDAGGLSSREYLELGEVQRAFDLAALRLDGTEAAVRARLVEDAGAAFEDVTPHVHPSRLALIGQTAGVEHLGAGVHKAIEAHLASGCMVCREARRQAVGTDLQAA